MRKPAEVAGRQPLAAGPRAHKLTGGSRRAGDGRHATAPAREVRRERQPARLAPGPEVRQSPAAPSAGAEEQIFGRDGLHLPKQKLCDWTLASAEALRPIVDRLLQIVSSGVALQLDDTPVMCQAGRGEPTSGPASGPS